jgi:hypothetical protein
MKHSFPLRFLRRPKADQDDGMMTAQRATRGQGPVS